jgi:hypothetical protein
MRWRCAPSVSAWLGIPVGTLGGSDGFLCEGAAASRNRTGTLTCSECAQWRKFGHYGTMRAAQRTQASAGRRRGVEDNEVHVDGADAAGEGPGAEREDG